jgi:hypothetical protein
MVSDYSYSRGLSISGGCCPAQRVAPRQIQFRFCKTWRHSELHVKLCLMDFQHTAPLYIVITNRLTVGKFKNLSRINSIRVCTSYSVHCTHELIPNCLISAAAESTSKLLPRTYKVLFSSELIVTDNHWSHDNPAHISKQQSLYNAMNRYKTGRYLLVMRYPIVLVFHHPKLTPTYYCRF